MSSVRLHVNIDHIATVRNARGTTYPDPCRGAIECLDAGADGITAHLREDRRHIRDEDVELLRKVTLARNAVFNLEMAATDEMVAIAIRQLPQIVTLVPERREERTTEGGLDVVGAGEKLAECISRLHEKRLPVSLFIDPSLAQVRKSHELGVRGIELHTGDYAHATGEESIEKERRRIEEAAQLAHSLGLEVAAGHGLTIQNTPKIAKIGPIVELNIGHALIAESIFLSLKGAVQAFKKSMAR